MTLMRQRVMIAPSGEWGRRCGGMRRTGGEGGCSIRRRFGPQARESRLQTQRSLVQLVVRQVTRGVEQVVQDLGTGFDLVRRLLEVFDLANHVRDLSGSVRV